MLGGMWWFFAGCWYTEEEFQEDLLEGICGGKSFSINDDAPADATIPYFGMNMTGIPSGTFCMGSDEEEANSDEQPVHAVALTRPFWLGTTEVTQAEYLAATGETPSSNAGCDDCPVEEVSWYDAAILANVLSDEEGLEVCYDYGTEPEPSDDDPYDCEGFRLPTEAEWEYAARAGEYTTYAGSDDIDEVAWYAGNADSTEPVCGLDPNAWGLCDMSGNAWEWTGDGYFAYPTEAQTDPSASGGRPVLRGGGWNEVPAGVRASVRFGTTASADGDFIGLRLARSAQ